MSIHMEGATPAEPTFDIRITCNLCKEILGVVRNVDERNVDRRVSPHLIEHKVKAHPQQP